VTVIDSNAISDSNKAEPGFDDVVSVLLCIRCSYALAGLSSLDTCPECGLPVIDSINSQIIEPVDHQTIRKVRRGIAFWLSAFVVFLSLPMLVILWVASLTSGDFVTVLSVVFMTIPLYESFAWVVGVYLTTETTSLDAWRPESVWRRWARRFSLLELAVMVFLYLMIFSALNGAANNWPPGLVLTGFFLILLGRVVSMFLIGRWLPVVERAAGRGTNTASMIQLSSMAKLGAIVFSLLMLVLLIFNVSLIFDIDIPSGLGLVMFLGLVASVFGVWLTCLIATVGLFSLRNELQRRCDSVREKAALPVDSYK